MPKSKEFVESDADNSSNEENEKPKKRARTETKKPTAKAEKPSKAKTSKKEEDEDAGSDSNDRPESDGMYMLAKNRFISVSDFKGKAYVNIREYYEKDGKSLPGKKGISLSSEQWENLKKFIEKIDNDLKSH